MRAILINPQDQTIPEVEYNGDYKNIYTHIDAKSFDCVRFGDKEDNTIFVDDEGLLTDKPYTVGMFRVDGKYPAYLAGKGLILANNAAGESVATKLDIEELRARIVFGIPTSDNGRATFWEARRTISNRWTPTGRRWDMDA
jgi:hypothetical protein